MAHRRPIIGIDLGTTRSAAAYVGAGGHVTCLPGRDGEVLTPSCVCIGPDGLALVGRRALESGLRDPQRRIQGFKRHLGEEDWNWCVEGRDFSAVTLSALVLRQLSEDAVRAVGPIGGAVITVPAYFGDRQRTATLDAAAAAELDVIRLVNEPTAAAVAGAFESYVAAGGDGADLTTAAIAATAPAISVLCDLGGGTFDVTVIRADGHRFEVIATGGRPLGGRDFDEFICEAMVRHIFDCNGPDPHHDPTALAAMEAAAEQAKHTLTVKGEVQMPAPYPRIEPLTLTRERFETDCVGLIDRARQVIEGVMADAKLEWPRVESLLLVGGASRMPMFRRMVAQVAAAGPTPQMQLQPDLIVAHGAAVLAAIGQVQGEQPSRSAGERSPASFGSDGSAADLAESTADCPPDDWPVPAFEPDFMAAAGAVQVRDVTSCSLGVVVNAPNDDRLVNAVVIPRNSPLPALRTRTFATHDDNQTRVLLPIVEGEHRDADACTQIGQCVIDDLPPNLPKGSPVEVTFSYDSSGRVHVRAEELATRTGAQTILDRAASVSAPMPRTALDELAHAVAQI